MCQFQSEQNTILEQLSRLFNLGIKEIFKDRIKCTADRMLVSSRGNMTCL